MKPIRDNSAARAACLAGIIAIIAALLVAARPAPPLLMSGLSKKQIVRTTLQAAGAAPASIDTLHIIAFLVQFKPDTSRLTTGTGLFGDMDDKEEAKGYQTDTIYTYDGLPHDRAYFARQLDFAADYFATVSRGHLFLRHSIFAPAGNDAYSVPHSMPYYSPGGKRKKESWDEYYYRKTVGLMKFVKDAVAQFGSDPAPFAGLVQDSASGIIRDSRGHAVVFLIIHAGASYLTDGGKEGFYGQDTPSDMIDAFIAKDWFKYFRDTLNLDADGIYVRAGNDSILIDEIMMIPETSNQDGLNWGIHGILVNQIARQLGIPDLWSTSSGISGVGAFCIMDFSGYSAGNGFIPPWPSAWVRLFMGWERPAIARPGENRAFRLTAVSAADPAADTTMLLVPLNDHEYYLLENRQRCLDGDVSVFKYDTSQNKDTVYISSYPYNVNIHRAADSVSGKGASNVILRVKNYDVSLPASGVLVWHVDERIIRDRIAYNMINADSAYRGVALVEADGIGDLGIMFQDMLGQAAFDYGGAEDVFPHRSIKFKKGDFVIDSLGPFTRPSSKSNDGGHTYLTVRIPRPPDARIEKAAVRNYYIDNFAAKDFSVHLRWSPPPPPTEAALTAMRPEPAPSWPRRMAPEASFLEPVVCDLYRGDQTSELAVISASGRLYLWSADSSRPNSFGALTDTIAAMDMTLRDSISILDSSRVALERMAVRYLQLPAAPSAMPSSINGRLYLALDSTIVVCDSIYASVSGGEPDSLAMRSAALPAAATTHIALLAGGTWAVGAANGMIFAGDTGAPVLSHTLSLGDDSPVCGLAALNGEAHHLACIQRSGLLSVAALFGASLDTIRINGIPPYSLVTADIDNDGENEIVVTDSRQGVWCFNRNLSVAQGWERSPIDWASVYTYRENASDTARALSPANFSAPALADINRDGHLDIVLGGANGLYALNYKGVLLYGWPSYLDNRFWYWRQSVRVSPVVAVDRASNPLTLFATPTGERETYSFFRIDSIHADRYRVYFKNDAGNPDSATNVSPSAISPDSLYRGNKIDSVKIDKARSKNVKVFYTRSDGTPDSVSGLKPGLVDTLLVYGDSLIPDYILPGGLVDARTSDASRPGFVTALTNVGSERQSYWPLTTGSSPATAPMLCDIDRNDSVDLFIVSSTGWVYRWILAEAAPASKQWWPQVGHDGGRSFSCPALFSTPLAEKATMLQLFSYPNPTDGASSVQFRYKFGGPARNVRLDIYTYTGYHVYSWKAPRGLYETNWRDWNELPAELSLRNYGPGVYRCRMEAEISNGAGSYTKHHTYWKMAVIK